MATMKRRDVLGICAVGASALAFGAVEREASAVPVAPPGTPAFAGRHQPAALPFNPSKLAGLSERMLVSHHDNNYVGAIKNLNKLEEQLAATTKDTPSFLIAGLKERELTFTNSMILHEQYFEGLGGDGKAGGSVEQKLAASYGAFGKWEEHFRSVGLSLAGGSGWAILDYSLLTGDVRTYWAGNHTQTLAGGLPLLVMDMYEHAYAIDYGAAAAKYVDAFFHNVNWEIVERRLRRAEKAAAALGA
jgi:Fe-Mn family superoxide dismutase